MTVQMVVDRLSNFKFKQALTAAGQVPAVNNHTMRSIQALAETYGDSGWFSEGCNTMLIVEAAVAHIIQELSVVR